MEQGYNKADLFSRVLWSMMEQEFQKRPCVFLSHKREDKPQCRKVADYLSKVGIDYYLDELDDNLQRAAYSQNSEEITQCIKKGISESSHMLVVVSGKTYRSQWVPFEVGYGHSAILDKDLKPGQKLDKLKLAILTLKDISEDSLPDYMQVGHVIRGTKSLNEYIRMISNKFGKSILNEARGFSHNSLNHPLDNVLNWKL